MLVVDEIIGSSLTGYLTVEGLGCGLGGDGVFVLAALIKSR